MVVGRIIVDIVIMFPKSPYLLEVLYLHIKLYDAWKLLSKLKKWKNRWYKNGRNLTIVGFG